MYLPLLPAAHDMIAAGAEVLALGRVPWLDATTGEPWLHPTTPACFYWTVSKSQASR